MVLSWPEVRTQASQRPSGEKRGSMLVSPEVVSAMPSTRPSASTRARVASARARPAASTSAYQSVMVRPVASLATVFTAKGTTLPA
ncbi:MAG: hypothetical protein U1F43_10210 [Myxococcota bacterium]